MRLDGIEIVTDFMCTKQEKQAYVDYVLARIEDVDKIVVHLCEDDTVDITWVKYGQKFERIRRITGYLTGDLKTWNDAKRSEEHDRVKHGGLK